MRKVKANDRFVWNRRLFSRLTMIHQSNSGMTAPDVSAMEDGMVWLVKEKERETLILGQALKHYLVSLQPYKIVTLFSQRQKPRNSVI